jgi:hypothetical protein
MRHEGRQDNIKIHLKKITYDYTDWIYLTQDTI